MTRDASGRLIEGSRLNPEGRPPGIVDQHRKEIRGFARRFLEEEKYRLNVEERILAGKALLIEMLLYHYAYGKPPDKLVVDDRRPPFQIVLRREIQLERARVEEEPDAPEEPGAPPPPRPTPRALPGGDGDGQGMIFWDDRPGRREE